MNKSDREKGVTVEWFVFCFYFVCFCFKLGDIRIFCVLMKIDLRKKRQKRKYIGIHPNCRRKQSLLTLVHSNNIIKYCKKY